MLKEKMSFVNPEHTGPPPILKALFLLFGGFVATGLLQLAIHNSGILSENNELLVGVTIQQILGFAIPAFLFFQWTKIHLEKNSSKIPYSVFMVLLLFVFTYLLTGQLVEWNYELVSSWNVEAFSEMEQQADEINIKVLSGPSVFIQILIMAILPGICEELFFRGVFLKSLGLKMNFHVANLITSIIFAGLHFQPYKIVAMFLLSIILGYIYFYTRNILYPIVFHFMNNFLGVLVFNYSALETQNWMPYESKIPMLYYFIVVIGILIYIGQKRPRKSF